VTETVLGERAPSRAVLGG